MTVPSNLDLIRIGLLNARHKRACREALMNGHPVTEEQKRQRYQELTERHRPALVDVIARGVVGGKTRSESDREAWVAEQLRQGERYRVELATAGVADGKNGQNKMMGFGQPSGRT